MARDGITDDELALVIGQLEEAASAWMRGDMDTYLRLIKHSRDYTLMPPLGGGPVRHETRREDLANWRSPFRAGSSKLEDVQAYVSGDLVVLAMIERQHGEVGDLPDQDWSVRVTVVFRREDAEWRLLHRHADALVHDIDPQTMAALARGQPA